MTVTGMNLVFLGIAALMLVGYLLRRRSRLSSEDVD